MSQVLSIATAVYLVSGIFCAIAAMIDAEQQQETFTSDEMIMWVVTWPIMLWASSAPVSTETRLWILLTVAGIIWLGLCATVGAGAAQLALWVTAS